MKYFLVISIIISLFFSMKKSCINNELEIILPQYVEDETEFTFKIKNNSNNKYYLPIHITGDFKICKTAYSSCDKRKYLYIHEMVTTAADTLNWEVLIIDNNIDKEDFYNYQDECNFFIKNNTVKSIQLLKPNSEIEISYPFALHVQLDDSSILQIDNNENKELFLSLNIFNRDLNMRYKYLNKEVLDSIEDLGYKMYSKKIISNNAKILY